VDLYGELRKTGFLTKDQCFEVAELVEKNFTDVQQLKAEILPLLDEAIGDLKLGHYENAEHWLNKLSEKLSAV